MKNLIDVYEDKKICKEVDDFLERYEKSRKKDKEQFFVDFINKYKKELKISEYLSKEAYEQCENGLMTYCTDSFNALDESKRMFTAEHMKKIMLKTLDVKDKYLKEAFENRLDELEYDKEKEFLIDLIINYDSYEEWSNELGDFLEKNGLLIDIEEDYKDKKNKIRAILDEIYNESDYLVENFGEDILEEIYGSLMENNYEITKSSVIQIMLVCYTGKMQ